MCRRLVLIALVVPALLVGGCKGDSDTSGSPSGANGSKPPSEATLKGYLLEKDDLPGPFEEQDDQEDDDAAPSEGCIGQDTDDTVPPAGEAEAHFATKDGGTQVSHEVAAYEPGKAEEAVAEGRKLAERCSSFDEPVGETRMRGSLRPATVNALGDETVAFTFQATVSTVSLNGLMMVVRKGNVVTSVSYIVANGPVVTSIVEDLARKAVEKLPA